MGQISVEIYNPPGSTLSDNQHAADLDPFFAATPLFEGDFYGWNTKRFGSLLKRSDKVAALVRHPLILGIAEKILRPHCDRILLNLTQGIEILPRAAAQYPHRDEDMWAGPKGEIEYLINVMPTS